MELETLEIRRILYKISCLSSSQLFVFFWVNAMEVTEIRFLEGWARD